MAKSTHHNQPAEQSGTTLAAHRPRPLIPHMGIFGPLGHLRSEFDRLFDEFFQGWATPWQGGHEVRWGLDMHDRGEAIVIRAEAPGFESGDFDLQVHDDHLILSATKKTEKKEGKEEFEFQQHELYRSVPLPVSVDAEKVDAKYHNGVLTITLPKTEKSKGKRIEVKG